MDFIEAIIEDMADGNIVIAGLPDGMSSGIAVEIAEAVKRKGLGQWAPVRSAETGQQTPAQSVRQRSQSGNAKGLVLWADATDKDTAAKAWGEYALRSAGSPEVPWLCIAMQMSCAKACRENSGLRRRFWEDFVTSTDSRVLAERHVRRFEHGDAHVALKCSLVAELAGPDLAFATQLADKPLEHILDPANYFLGSIWAAQVSILFPLIERERRRLLGTYRDVWNLPHVRKDGWKIRCLEELEIGDMDAQAQQSRALKSERERLDWLRRVRNSLAHLKIVPWATLTSPIARQIVNFT